MEDHYWAVKAGTQLQNQMKKKILPPSLRL
jgi:hypothetical protein